jgi:hypothetical protein
VIALIDGDILTYRIGFAYNDEGLLSLGICLARQSKPSVRN